MSCDGRFAETHAESSSDKFRIAHGARARGIGMTHQHIEVVHGSPFALRHDGAGHDPPRQHLRGGMGNGAQDRR